jgi:DNA polymerase (family 10)
MFTLLSKLMDIHQENSFKAKSYASAAFTIDKLTIDLSEIPREQLFSLKGIGESSAKKIIEILDTGRLSALDEIVSKTPPGILEMLQIKGLGPKKISTIWKEMGIESIGELLYACNENRLMLYKGFGEKTQANVAEAIEYFLRNQGHFLFAEIETYALHMQEVFEKQFPSNRFQGTGDFIRQMPTLDELVWVTDLSMDGLKKFLSENAFEVQEENGTTLRAIGQEKVKLVFHAVPSNQIQREAFLKSGSEAFMSTLHEKLVSLEPDLKDEEVFKRLSLPYFPAYLREDPVHLQKLTATDISEIIQPDQIKGIIHTHSDWSDGTDTIENMAKACIAAGYEYLVISDHSKSAFYANGLNEERIKAQHQYIDELNAKLAPFRIFKSVESDILNDGALDYSDSILSTFDLVIASVHSNLKMSEEKAMERLIRAIENPFTTILGHPTGRLLLSRKGYPIDHKKIIDACIAHKVAIEINAHPRRLDLDWSWVAQAQEKGALLSINPDAHYIEGFKDTRYGILAAQKGGLRTKNNLSSFGLDEFEKFIRLKK